MHIAPVGSADVDDLLPLMREYCDFYGVDHRHSDLEGLSRALIADPDCEGVQLVAGDEAGGPVGFATVYWCWSTLSASRTAVMNDLFVCPEGRGRGVAEALSGGVPRPCRSPGRDVAALADGQGQRPGAAGVRAGGGLGRGVAGLRPRPLKPGSGVGTPSG